MKKTTQLSELTLDELIIRKKKMLGVTIGLGIVMLLAAIFIVYVALKSKNAGLMAVPIGSALTLLPTIINLSQINTEIKSRIEK